jgi:dephospho-CoA kinase
MKVIGLCGKTGAGKDEAAEWISLRHGGVALKHSNWLRECLARNGRSEVPEKMSALWRAIAGELGWAWLANEMIVQIIQEDLEGQAQTFSVNGIRNVEEVAAYRGQFQDSFTLVAIHAPQTMRYQRVKNRGTRPNERDMVWEDFLAIEALPSHADEEKVMALADVNIRNEVLIGHLHAELDRLFRP